MPKASQFINATRTILVPLTFEADGERKTEEFKVIYRAYSPKVARELAALEEDETNRSVAKSLAGVVVSLPDITDDNERPLAITEETLNEFANENLTAIYQAILKDIRPTPAPTTSTVSPSTSATEPAAQN
jgi:hypothetical protein